MTLSTCVLQAHSTLTAALSLSSHFAKYWKVKVISKWKRWDLDWDSLASKPMVLTAVLGFLEKYAMMVEHALLTPVTLIHPAIKPIIKA